MHPDVIKPGPGKCPRCGMDLVPFTPQTPTVPGAGSRPAATPAAETHPAAPGMDMNMNNIAMEMPQA